MKQRLAVILALLPIWVWAQQGRVLDESRQPLEFVVVSLPRTSYFTYTDAEGRFHLPQARMGDTLVFQSVGYETLRRPLRKESEEIVLRTLTYALPEVAVSPPDVTAMLLALNRQLWQDLADTSQVWFWEQTQQQGTLRSRDRAVLREVFAPRRSKAEEWEPTGSDWYYFRRLEGPPPQKTYYLWDGPQLELYVLCNEMFTPSQIRKKRYQTLGRAESDTSLFVFEDWLQTCTLHIDMRKQKLLSIDRQSKRKKVLLALVQDYLFQSRIEMDENGHPDQFEDYTWFRKKGEERTRRTKGLRSTQPWSISMPSPPFLRKRSARPERITSPPPVQFRYAGPDIPFPQNF